MQIIMTLLLPMQTDTHKFFAGGFLGRHFDKSVIIIIEGSNNKQSVLMIMSIETITALWEADIPPPRRCVKSAEPGLWPSVGEKFTDKVF